MTIQLSHEEILRYSRNLLIPEVGLEGQRKLKGASVLIIGTGGLGSPVSLYLAAVGIGHIGLVDFDVVETSNLQRQVIHGVSGIGMPKVESARRRLLDLNPFIQVDVYNDPFTSDNALRIAEGFDLIIDCTDNFPARYLLNDLCVLTGKPNIYGAIYRFDGQVSVFDAKRGPCYRCLFPEPPLPGHAPICAEGGVLGVLPGTIGSIQANEAIKLVLGVGEALIGKLLLYNALDMTFDFINLRKNPMCKVCGEKPVVTGLVDYEAFCHVSEQGQEIIKAAGERDISPGELNERIKNGWAPVMIDVREPHELLISHIKYAELIPLGQLAGSLSGLDSADEFVVFCRNGSRSRRALELLLSAGFHSVWNLQGGINAWIKEVDPDQPVY